MNSCAVTEEDIKHISFLNSSFYKCYKERIKLESKKKPERRDVDFLSLPAADL